MTKEDAKYKSQAISTNYYLISRMIEKDTDFSIYNYHDFIERAAKWSYRVYGFGKADLTGYIEYLQRRINGRLYNQNVQLWYKIIKTVFKRDNYTCSYCGAIGGKLECDHIYPFSKGGTNELSNLTTSCRKCNRQKKDKTVEEFNKWKNK